MLVVISKKNFNAMGQMMNEAANEQTKANKKRAIISTSIAAGSSIAATAAAAVITNVITAKKLKRATAETKANIETMNTNMEVCLATMAKHDGYSLAQEVAKFIKEAEAEEKKEAEEKEEEEENNNNNNNNEG